MKASLIIVAILFSLVTKNAFAVKECVLNPDKIWFPNSSTSLWVCFDTGICIKSYTSEVGEKIIDRTLSMALAAVASGKSLRVRFTDDNFDCNASSGSYSDYEGIWFLE